MNLFTEFLKRNKQKRISVGVVGNSMIDEYYYVNVKKISPEFPIPVMHSDNATPTYSLPGGAANVAYQFKHFNADVKLISCIDSEAHRVFASHGIDASWCQRISTPIPRKRRFYSDDFPTYRWDVETNYKSHMSDAWPQIFSLLKKTHHFFDVLIFSDYNKGFFSKAVADDLIYNFSNCRYRIVDPKKDLSLWKGCTLIKPNYSEACDLTGSTHVQEQMARIRDICECEMVMVTMGGKGVQGEHFGYKDSDFSYEPRTSISPNSVIGAGDCFMAFTAMGLAHDFMLSEIAEIAFEMGALYVQEKHNSPISIEKILKKFDPEAAKYIVPELPRDYSLAFSNGCFDILHRGHIETLKFAKSKAEKLVVAVNTDESVAKLKPGRPINNLANRMSVLAGLEFVDYVVPFVEDTPYELIKKLKPDVLVKGEPYCIHNVVGADLVDKVYIAPKFEDLSSTGAIKKWEELKKNCQAKDLEVL